MAAYSKEIPVAGANGNGQFLFGDAPVMLELKKKVALVAAADVPVLITGESGTGKELLALEIHRLSQRSANPFVKVNCAAIPAPLMEAELFGFERGAFTGAVARRTGKFELASSGTIFLDDIADLVLALQPKLLQVLQDNNLALIGGSEEITLDTRVICATNHDLGAEVQGGQFRQDLYYRINVVHIHLPPLRERMADLAVLAEHLLGRYRQLFARTVPEPSSALLNLFVAYHWPGNVRELENILKQYVILQNEADLIRALELRLREEMEQIAGPDGTVPLKKHVKAVAQKSEKELILKVLRHNRWNRKKTARMLKISYRALLYKLKESGLDQRVSLSFGD